MTLITAAALDDVATTAAARDGIAAAEFAGDTAEQYVMDTIAAGEGIADERIVRLVTRDGPGRIGELRGYGASRNGGREDPAGGNIMADPPGAVPVSSTPLPLPPTPTA